MTHLNNLRLDPHLFANLQVNPYSGLSVIVRYVHNCYVGNNLFDSLMLGTYAQFNFLVESVSSLGMGSYLFNALQQDQFSVFYMQVDQIGVASSSTKKTRRSAAQAEDYYEYYDDEEQEMSAAEAQQQYNSWLCVPEGLFKNVQQYESALAQVQFRLVLILNSRINFLSRKKNVVWYKMVNLGKLIFQLMV